MLSWHGKVVIWRTSKVLESQPAVAVALLAPRLGAPTEGTIAVYPNIERKIVGFDRTHSASASNNQRAGS